MFNACLRARAHVLVLHRSMGTQHQPHQQNMHAERVGVLAEALRVVQQRMADSRRLVAEFRTVVELDRLIDHTVYVSQQAENTVRNRYVNVLPYDYNRVRLRGSEPHSDYINASALHVEDRASGMQLGGWGGVGWVCVLGGGMRADRA